LEIVPHTSGKAGWVRVPLGEVFVRRNRGFC
jgi:hypothetical protein